MRAQRRAARAQPGGSRRARRQLWIALAAVAVLAVFAAGIALGMAIHDNPQPGPLVTVERTVKLPPAPAR